MVQIEGLFKRFATVQAVNINRLEIKQGEIIGLVGNNGAGKTTLLRLILDLYKADVGSVYLNGENVYTSEKWKTFTGSFIDEGFLIDFLTPEEYFYFIANCHGLDKSVVDGRLLMFDKFMNNEILQRKKLIKTLSAGNKQKVGIIGAMIINPDLLILDEPFNFLDPSSQIELVRLLKYYNNELCTTMILSSHNLEHVCNCASRILLMEKGEIIQDVPTNNITLVDTIKNYFVK